MTRPLVKESATIFMIDNNKANLKRRILIMAFLTVFVSTFEDVKLVHDVLGTSLPLKSSW